MANRVELPKDTNLAGKVLEAEHASKVVDMGKIGVYFGSRENAIIYLAALVIVAAVLGASAIAIAEPSLRPDVLKALAALALSALGYMFGAGGRRSD